MHRYALKFQVLPEVLRIPLEKLLILIRHCKVDLVKSKGADLMHFTKKYQLDQEG